MTDVPQELDPAVNSSALEHVLEHVFLSELLQEAWFGRGAVIDVLHTSVDAFGYDVVLEHDSVIRHVQLKARRLSGRQSRLKVNSLLATRPSGCVVWMGWERAPATNRLSIEYRWFGGLPGERLPALGDVVAKHAKANAAGVKLGRLGIRVLGLGLLEKVDGTAELLVKLFGPVEA